MPPDALLTKPIGLSSIGSVDCATEQMSEANIFNMIPYKETSPAELHENNSKEDTA